MFYAEAILSRRGPLAKVWLAAHWERKLSKTQTLQTDISQSVDAIMGQEVVPMALRLSGQLLLGVCRIYSRKAKYLLDDCNEALLKIKMAFRPGLVDMTDEQLTVNRNAITIQGDGFDIDLMADTAWDFDFVDRPVGGQGQQHIARQADITLADNMHFDFDANYDFELGPADGIGSQDFGLDDFDIGVDFGDQEAAAPSKEKAKSKSKKNKGDGEETEGEEEEDEDMSVEIGRDASITSRARHSELHSALKPTGGDFDDFDVQSRGGLEDYGDAAADFGGDMAMDLDLGINFGDEERAPEERPKTPEAVRDASRASSPLTAPPATPPPQAEEGQTDRELTPRAEAPAKKKKGALKKVIIDSVTELEDGPGARFGRGGFNSQARDVSEITAPVEFLPRSRTVMALMHIRQDPLAHFMPTVTNERGTFFCAAPPGMAPELTNLFMFPTHTPSKTRRGRAAGASDTEGEGRSPKRARLATEEQDDDEVGRRASVAPSAAARSDIFGRDGGDISLGGFGADDTTMDVDGGLGGGELDIDIGGAVEDAKRRASSKARQTPGPVSQAGLDDLQIGAPEEEDRRSRYSTPADGFGGDEVMPYSDVVCPIAAFDERPSKESQTQTQNQQEEEDVADESNKDGYSKQTVKAMGLLRKQFKALEVEDDATPRKTRKGTSNTAETASKPVSFKKLSEKASRRAAASFFFELLVLGTRDCVKLNQSETQKFDNIEIRAKEKLWQTDADMAGLNSRQPSAAPSDL